MGNVEWNNFIPQFVKGAGNVNDNKPVSKHQQLPQTQETGQTSAASGITADMSELEVKAAMNQALGFTRSSNTDVVRMAKADAEFRQDPVAFAKKHASEEVRANAQEAGIDADYKLQAFRGDTELAQIGPRAFVKNHIGQPAEVARNFAQARITEELDKIFA